MSIHSDTLTVQIDSSNQIEHGLALGGVVIRSGDQTAYSERAELHVEEGRLVLSEKPRVETPKGIFIGDVLSIWLDDDRIACEGQCRVEVMEGQ